MRDCLIIHGMHRSGTSACAGAAHVLGAGLPRDLMPATPHNPRGYFEPLWLVRTNDALLARIGRDWRDSRPLPAALREGLGMDRRVLAARLEEGFGPDPLIVLKDPRIALLAPLWEDVALRSGRRVAHILCLRAPEEVAASLARRDGMATDAALALWLRYVLAAERDTRGRRRAFVDVAALCRDPLATMEAVGRRLDLTWPLSPQTQAAALTDFVAAELLHPAPPLTDALPELLALARRAHTLLWQVAQETALSAQAEAELDDIHAALDRVTPVCAMLDSPGMGLAEAQRLIGAARTAGGPERRLTGADAIAGLWLGALERWLRDAGAARKDPQDMAELAALTHHPWLLWRHLTVLWLCLRLARLPILTARRRAHFARLALRRDLVRLTRPADQMVSYARLAGQLGRCLTSEAAQAQHLAGPAAAMAGPLPRLAVVVHCFYPDVLSDILDRLALCWQGDWRLYITCPPDLAAPVAALASGFDAATVLAVENFGRDVRPFFAILPQVLREGAEVILKVHTKKSPHREDGPTWGNRLLQDLLDGQTIRDALARFAADAELGLVAPRGHVLRLPDFLMQNREGLRHLAARAHIDTKRVMAGHFVAGTMMFLRAAPLAELQAVIEPDRFEPEAGQLDGTYAHAVERFFVTFLRAAGFRMTDTGFAETEAEWLDGPGWI